MQSHFELLYDSEFLLTNVVGDGEVMDHLRAKQFPVDLLPQGQAMIGSAFASAARRDALFGEQIGATSGVETEFASTRSDFNMFRVTARRALSERPELLASIGLQRPKRGAEGQEEGQHETTPPPTEGKPKKRVRKYEPRTISWLVTHAKTTLTNAMEKEEVLSALAPHGYTRETLGALLARLNALAGMDRTQESKIGTTRGAVKDFHAQARQFRVWFIPMKMRLARALKGRPDLMKRVGLAA